MRFVNLYDSLKGVCNGVVLLSGGWSRFLWNAIILLLKHTIIMTLEERGKEEERKGKERERCDNVHAHTPLIWTIAAKLY